MSIFHMGSIKIATRGKGRSSVSHAAYQSGISMKNGWDGWEQKKVTKQKVIYHDVLLPEHAPKEFKDAEVLWNSVEMNEKVINAQLCRYFDIELQKEFSDQENKELVMRYVQETFVNQGMCAQIDIHKKKNGYSHAHVQLTMRQLDEAGNWVSKSVKKYLCRKDDQELYLSADEFKRKKVEGFEKVYRYEHNGNVLQMTRTDAEFYPEYVRKSKDPVSRKVDLNDAWNDSDNAVKWRAAWAEINNEMFEKKNLPGRIDHRSYEEQEIPVKPRKSYTRSEWEQKQRGIVTQKELENNQIDNFNDELDELYGIAQDAIYTMEWQTEHLELEEQTSVSIKYHNELLNEQDGIVKAIVEAELLGKEIEQRLNSRRLNLKDRISKLIEKYWNMLKMPQKPKFETKKPSLNHLISFRKTAASNNNKPKKTTSKDKELSI